MPYYDGTTSLVLLSTVSWDLSDGLSDAIEACSWDCQAGLGALIVNLDC